MAARLFLPARERGRGAESHASGSRRCAQKTRRPDGLEEGPWPVFRIFPRNALSLPCTRCLFCRCHPFLPSIWQTAAGDLAVARLFADLCFKGGKYSVSRENFSSVLISLHFKQNVPGEITQICMVERPGREDFFLQVLVWEKDGWRKR